MIPMHILVIGDSLGVGLTAPLSVLAKASGSDVKGISVSGSTVKQWANEHKSKITAALPGINTVLVSLGTNDMKANRGDFAKDINSVIDAATAGGATVAWITPPPMPFPEQDVRGEIEKVATPRSVPVFTGDVYGKDYPRAADKIHLTPEGYAKFASDIAAWLPINGDVAPKAPTDKTSSSPAANTVNAATDDAGNFFSNLSTGGKVALGATAVVVIAGIAKIFGGK